MGVGAGQGQAEQRHLGLQAPEQLAAVLQAPPPPALAAVAVLTHAEPISRPPAAGQAPSEPKQTCLLAPQEFRVRVQIYILRCKISMNCFTFTYKNALYVKHDLKEPAVC